MRRGFWRRGYGTALLWAAFEALGPGVEVIRVLGRFKAADRRALGFYEATGGRVVARWRRLLED